MKEAIDKVKRAVSARSVVTALTHYLIKEGTIYATDGRMIATAPIDDDRTYLVPAVDLEKCISRMDDPTVEVFEESIKIKSGRMRATIQTLHPDMFALLMPEGEKSPVPEAMVTALRKVRPFISDNATQTWAMCAFLDEDGIYATNNISVIKADCEGIQKPGLVPSWAIDYIITREEELTHMAWGDNSITFFWDDKSWMRTQLVIGEFHPKLKELIQNIDDPTFEIKGEWLEAYWDVVALTEDSVTITPDKLIGGKGLTRVEMEINTSAVAEETVWDPRYLDKVFKVARYWEPGSWPNPAAFKGEGVAGIVLGRRA